MPGTIGQFLKAYKAMAVPTAARSGIDKVKNSDENPVRNECRQQE
jgi:hypothetical protein